MASHDGANDGKLVVLPWPHRISFMEVRRVALRGVALWLSLGRLIG